MSQRQAAKVLGVSYTTIQRDTTQDVSESDTKRATATGCPKTKARRAASRYEARW
jgi:transposase